MISRGRRVLMSAAVSLAMIAVPCVAMTVVVVPDWSEKILPFFMLALVPGFFVSVMPGGNVHDDSRVVVCLSSFLFWFAVVYGVTSLIGSVNRARWQFRDRGGVD